MKIAIVAITDGGNKLARRIADGLDRAVLLDASSGVATAVASAWPEYDGFVLIMACGIAVRTVAPLLRNKNEDPCVVVCDELGNNAISLLSGHLGGGNALAREVAALTNGTAVITTASDTLALTSLDLWARDLGLAWDKEDMTRLSGLLVNRGQLKVYLDSPLPELPSDLLEVKEVREADMIVSPRTDWPEGKAVLHPRSLIVGIGCNRGTSMEQIEQAVVETLAAHTLSRRSIDRLASIDVKSDEVGLLEFARSWDLEIEFYSKDQLNSIAGLERSEVVFRATGAYGVSEPAAQLASNHGRLLVAKTKNQDVTIAVAEKGNG